MAGTFGGQRVSYRATIAETVLESDDGKPEAVVVTTSYVKQPRDTARPVFFLFNGGPGSGSVWLQMGAFGPKRVAIPSDARDGAPPYPLLDNPDSLLDIADLVFIDPPGTGFSYLPKGPTKKYYGLEQDAEAVAKIIRLWTTMAAGTAPNISAAKAMAPRAPRWSRASSKAAPSMTWASTG